MKYLTFFKVTLVWFFLVFPICVVATFATEIYDCDDLDNIPDDSDDDYFLNSSLDCSNFKQINLGYTGFNNFNGSFDGRNFTIFGLYMNDPSSNAMGLISSTRRGAKIYDVGVIDIFINGGNDVGAICGDCQNSDISRVFATGFVNGSSRIGGIVGDNYEGNLNDSFSFVNVSGITNVGGLIGRNERPIYTKNSFSIGSVNGVTDIGGFAGENTGHISYSFSTGFLTASSLGLFIGYQNNLGNNSNNYVYNYTLNELDFIGSDNGITTNSVVQSSVSYFYDVSNAPMSTWDFTNKWSNVNDTIYYPPLKNFPVIIEGYCGNSHCFQYLEDCSSCPVDCGVCPTTDGGGSNGGTNPPQDGVIPPLSDFYHLVTGGGSLPEIMRVWNPSVYDNLGDTLKSLVSGTNLKTFGNDLFNTIRLLLQYLFRQPASLIAEGGL
jgi:hypothetical protein